MADYNPYGKAPKGETASAKTARQKKFYTQQRVNAEKGAKKGKIEDIDTLGRIRSKIGRDIKTGKPRKLLKSNSPEQTVSELAKSPTPRMPSKKKASMKAPMKRGSAKKKKR